MIRKSVVLLALPLTAAGLGLYVYPTRPGLVWVLLAVCWVCYRLQMRAAALFGEPEDRKRNS